MNKTLKLLILSDVFLFTGLGLIAPILAIFIKEDLGGSIMAAGIASTLYLIVKATLQIPFSRYLDKHKNKRFFVILGYAIMASVPFLYIFIKNVSHLYAVQIFYGMGSALAYPAWLSLFSTHLEKHHEGYDWSLYSSSVTIGMAISAAVGATLAQYMGFKFTFFIVGIFSIFGVCSLFFLEKKELQQKRKVVHYQGIVVKHNRH